MRVRLARVEDIDLNLFQFDLDLTMMIFFLNADEHIYGRYGGRDGKDAETRQSLAGLRYAMQAALETHRRAGETLPPKARPPRQTVRDLFGGRRGGCVHCHEVKERQNAELKQKQLWTRDQIWRYPLPDNLGIVLDVDRGNVVKRVQPDSAAARVKVRPGDVLSDIDGTPVHSLADAQFALDKAPKSGSIEIAWRRGDEMLHKRLALQQGWRKSDLSWRRSMQWIVPSSRVYGRDLKPDERKARGLTEKQLAFWQLYPVSSAAKAAGVREEDIVLGFDGKQLEVTAYEFLGHVRGNYLKGDNVTIDILRGDKRLSLPFQLR